MSGYIGIVGHEAAKFTPETEAKAREVIRSILLPDTTVVSGGCHLGGIDIWAEEEADKLGIEKCIFKPTRLSWPGKGGFQERNIQIAEKSDIVHVIVVKELPSTYHGMRFNLCYHCNTKEHIKSGGCWTAKHALKLGKKAEWHVI